MTWGSSSQRAYPNTKYVAFWGYFLCISISCPSRASIPSPFSPTLFPTPFPSHKRFKIEVYHLWQKVCPWKELSKNVWWHGAVAPSGHPQIPNMLHFGDIFCAFPFPAHPYPPAFLPPLSLPISPCPYPSPRGWTRNLATADRIHSA